MSTRTRRSGGGGGGGGGGAGGSLADTIKGPYDGTFPYAAGDIVTYQGATYVASTDIVRGGFVDLFDRVVPSLHGDNGWTVRAGGIATDGAEAVQTASSAFWSNAIATQDTGSADGTFRLIVGATNGHGLFLRSSTGTPEANTLSGVAIRSDGGVYNFSGGAGYADLGAGATYAAGDVMEVTVTGTTFQVYKNGSLVKTFTSTLNATSTHHGFLLNQGTATAREWRKVPVSAPFNAAEWEVLALPEVTQTEFDAALAGRLRWRGPWVGDDILSRYNFDAQTLPTDDGFVESGTGALSYPLAVPAEVAALGVQRCLQISSTTVPSNRNTKYVTQTVTIPAGGARLSFWRWVQSEAANFDYGEFHIDGVQQYHVSASEADWTKVTYTLAAGTRTLQWSFSNDGSGTAGFNGHRVADILLMAGSTAGAADTYAADDVVNYRGVPWVALQESTNVVPIDGAGIWKPMGDPAYVTDAELALKEDATAMYLQTIRAGALTVANDVIPPGLRVPKATTARTITCRVGTAPTGASLILTVERFNSAGVSQGLVGTVTIAASAVTAATSGLAVALTAGDVLKVNVTQVGSTVAGSDLNVSIDCS